jgi:ribonuclease HI
MTIEVFTDGSATTKEKPGGWAWVLIVDGQFDSEGSGSIPNATNNDAELEAAIKGLTAAFVKLHHGHNIIPRSEGSYIVTLCSDSEIILKWANGTNRFKQVAKMNQYRILKELMKRMKAHTRWIKGHSGHEWNERCDKLAGAARDLAMGVVRKPRTNRIKPLKEACEKMRETLEYVLKETLQMKADGYYRRDDFEDYCEAALDFYKEKIK